MKDPKQEAVKAVIRKIIAEALLDSNEGQTEKRSEREKTEENNEEAIEEFSSAGGVAGFTLPLGASPQTPTSPVLPGRKKIKRNKKKD